MIKLNWIKYDLKEIRNITTFWKKVYEVKGSPFFVKKITSEFYNLRIRDKEEVVNRLKEMQKELQPISKYLPETSNLIVCDENNEQYAWIVQEKIKGRDLAHLNWRERMYQYNKFILPQFEEMKKMCPSLDDCKENFIWDGKRKKLFYVDS